MQSDSFRAWLSSHPVPPWQWQPSSYGVRTELHKRGSVPGWDQYAEIYRNGTLVVWTPSAVQQESDGSHTLAYLAELRRLLEFLRLAKDLYGEIQYWGTLRFLVDIVYKPEPSPTLWFPYGSFPSDRRALITHDGALRIAFEESAATLNGSPNNVLKQLADEVFLAFGYWQATCFDDDLNLTRR